MANPRDDVSHEGVDAHYSTYDVDGSIVFDATKAGGSAVVGRAVKLVGDNKVGLTTEASGVKGKLILVESDGRANVQDEGYADLPGGDGAALTRGNKIVGAVGPGGAPGYIRAIANGTLAEVAVGRGEIIDNSDPAAVVVKL